MDELSYDTEAVLAAEPADYALHDDLTEAERLVATIEQAVWRNTSGKVKNLSVRVTRDGVVLTGRCSTYYAKQQAQHAAMQVPGGNPLINRIEVV